MQDCKRTISIKLPEKNFLAIQKLARNLQLSMTNFIQMKCLDLEVEEEIVEIKKRKVLKQKYACNRCGESMTAEEKEFSPICHECDKEMLSNDTEEEQPF